MLRYLVVIINSNRPRVADINGKNIVASYDAKFWGGGRALEWAKLALSQTKNGKLVAQDEKGYEFLQSDLT